MHNRVTGRSAARLWPYLLANPADDAQPWYSVPGATCVAAWQAEGAASYAASLVNLANPGTYDLTAVGSPAWNASDGWSGGAGDYFTTGYTPPDTSQSYTLFMKFKSGTCGVGTGGANRLYVWNRASDQVYGNGAGTIQGSAITAGVLCVAGSVAYLDGSQVTTGIGTGTGSRSTIHLREINGVSVSPSGDLLAAAIYEDVLTAGEVAAVSAAMASL